MTQSRVSSSAVCCGPSKNFNKQSSSKEGPSMNYPYLDPEWIPILKQWILPSRYDSSLTSDQIARESAYWAGKLDIASRLERITIAQEKDKGHAK
jgi:hypothetical protein